MTAQFRIIALSDPQALPRMINYAAQLSLTPDVVKAERINNMLIISIDQSGICEKQASIIAEKMRASVLVQEVTLTIE